ncbi:MAG: amino acid ABC transporter permease [Limnochordia bacterium]|nr:amino acid ABC transporter permease [Limnochordia bacterium]
MQLLEFIKTYTPLFIPATWITLQLTILSILLGCTLGLLTAFAKLSDKRLLNRVADVYITAIRGTPLIVQLSFIYFALPGIGINLSAFTSAVVGLGIHNGAYIAEIIRGGIQSIDTGQMEAARSVGMTYGKAMRRIILPQAFKRSVPPLGNQFIIALKDSSLAGLITVNEIYMTSRRLGASTYRQMEFYLMAGAFYLVMVTIFAFLVTRLEKRLQSSSRQASEVL